MLNLDSFDGFQPTARSLAEGYLKAARRLQKSPGMPGTVIVEPSLSEWKWLPDSLWL